MRSAIQIAQDAALGWWIFAIGATFLLTVHLPRVPYGSSAPGCYITSDWFDYVDCGSPLAGAIFGTPLTLAMLWTKDVQVLMDLATIPPLFLLMFLWGASVLLAATAPIRRLRKKLWAT